MKTIVTGCAGFIGSHVSERLLRDGCDVVGIDAFTDYYDPSAKVRNVSAATRHPSFRLVTADLAATDLDSLFTDAEVVFHLGAQPGVRGSFGSGFDDYVHRNITASQRVLEAALRTGVRRVVYASSSSVYGDADEYPVREATTPTRPRSPYGVTKRMCEDLAAVYRELGVESVGLRYFTVYGPRQRPDMAFRRICEAVTGGSEFELFGDGGQSRDFTHVDDVVDATVLAGTVGTVPPALNVGGGHEATMREAIAIIEELAGIGLCRIDAPVQRGDVRRTAADTTLARDTLGWFPRVGLASGLASELEWVRADRADRVERNAPADRALLVGSAA